MQRPVAEGRFYGTQQQTDVEVQQIDVSNRYHDIAAQHGAGIEYAVERFSKRDIGDLKRVRIVHDLLVVLFRECIALP